MIDETQETRDIMQLAAVPLANTVATTSCFGYCRLLHNFIITWWLYMCLPVI